MAKKLQTLRQYQDYLRERMDAAELENISAKVMFMGFLSGGKHYLIDSRDVIQMNQPSLVEPIPLGKPWTHGAANIKGAVHAITDFSILMGGERTKRGKFLILADEIMPGSALFIEAIAGLLDAEEIGEATLSREAGMPDWIAGNYNLQGRRYFLIDARKLALDSRFSKLQSGD